MATFGLTQSVSGAVTVSLENVSQVLKKMEKLHKHFDSKAARNRVQRPAAELFRDAAKVRAPRSDKPHFRWRKGGSKVATYNPGNLKRSIMILNDVIPELSQLEAFYVGPRYGGRPDGFYARWVEFSTDPRKKKHPEGQPFMRPAWDQMNGMANRIMRTKLLKLLDEFVIANKAA